MTAQVALVAIPAAASAPTVTADISSGHVFDTPRPTFTGSASDDSIVVNVEVAIRLEDPLLWVQPGGSFGAKFSRRGVEMSSRTSPTADWWVTIQSDLPDGEYRLWVSAQDDDGNRTTLKPQVRFTIQTDGLPMPFFDGPDLTDPGSGDHVFTTRDLTLQGTAIDDGGIVRVVVGVKQARTKLWLQPDGSFGSTVRKYAADLSAPGSKATFWSFAVSLPDDRYVVSVRAFDDERNSDSLEPWRRFKVDTVGPTIDVAFPFGARLLGPDVVLNGRVEDETLVFEARVAIKDRSTGLWLQPDGTFGPSHRKMDAGLLTCRPDQGPFCLPGTHNGGDERISAWLYEATLPPGDYSLSVRVWDAFENSSSVRPWHHFTVDPTIDTLPTPTTDVVAGDVFGSSPVVLTGDARDDIGIARVRIGIKDRDTGLWWTGFGFSNRVERFDATVDMRGAQDTTWHVEAALPDGRYALSVRAFDVQGYSQSMSPWVRFEVDTS